MRTEPGSRRAPRTAFRPGHSGNPGGRPRLTEDQRRARDLKAAKQPDAVAFLCEVIAGTVEGARVADRIAAARIILEGLEPVDESSMAPTNPFEGMSADDLVDLVRGLDGENASSALPSDREEAR